MTEQAGGPESQSPETAGELLRAARQAQGLHIAALATTLKVAPRKLEALEAGRYDEFQGSTFVRALALAACRALKIDPAPVLERLPAQDSGLLSQLDGGLNAPFRERGVRREVPELPGAGNAVWALGLLLLLGALGFWLLPKGWHWPVAGQAASAPSAASAASAAPDMATTSTATLPWPPASEASGPVPEGAGLATTPLPAAVSTPTATSPLTPPVVPPAPSPGASVAGLPLALPAAPAGSAASAAPITPAALAGTVVELRARAPSWVEVVDARSKVLIGRTLAPGETVGLDGVLPLRVKIGNAKATELSFRGRAVDLEATTRDNVARLELK